MKTIDALYCDVDDFKQQFYPECERQQLESGKKRRKKKGVMTPSEIMTIVIHFHQSNSQDYSAIHVFLK